MSIAAASLTLFTAGHVMRMLVFGALKRRYPDEAELTFLVLGGSAVGYAHQDAWLGAASVGAALFLLELYTVVLGMGARAISETRKPNR